MQPMEPMEPEVLSAYLDDELTVAERVAVEARLSDSAEWRAELAEVQVARDALRALPERDAPAGFWESITAAAAAADDEQDAAAAAPPDAPVVTLDAARSRRRRAWGWLAASAAAVAAIVAVVVIPHRSEVRPDVTAVVAQHGAQGSDSGDPVGMLAPVGPLAGFRR
jgi:anti-sigma factor RsiW